MTEGLKETFEVPVMIPRYQYHCEDCQHCRDKEYAENSCAVHPMLIPMLLVSGKTSCPFRGMTMAEIETEFSRGKEDQK